MEKINWLARKPINVDRVNDLLMPSVASNQFTNGGPAVKRLELTIRSLFKIDESKEIIAVNNGCSALHGLVSALNIYYGRSLRFATQSYTFPVSAQGPLIGSLIVDIDSDGGPRLDAIPVDEVDGLIITNVLGHLVDLKKYRNWSETNNKILILDNAATPWSFYEGKNSLNFGLGSILSFHHTKPVGFGEGGAIIVDREFGPSVRKAINFGYDMVKLDQIWLPAGSNFKMSDVSAVYILQYLENFESIRTTYLRLYSYFLKRLAEYPTLRPFPNFSDDVPLVSGMPVIFPRPIETQPFIIEGIEAKKYYKPLILNGFGLELYSRTICFPCHLEMTEISIDRIVNVINKILIN